MADLDQARIDAGAAEARRLLGKDDPGARAEMTDRKREILDHTHGKGRHRELAAHLAHKTSVSAETAIGAMGAAELDSEREDRARGDR